jgi:DNA-binding transcriptional regulator PaaX
MLVLEMPKDRKLRQQVRASLWFDGLHPWTPNTFIRPAWPQPWALNRGREYLARCGEIGVCGGLVEPLKPAVVAVLYALDDLDREAHRLARSMSKQRAVHSPQDAFAKRLKIGGLVARLAGHDPRLPAALWEGQSGMREVVKEYRRFEHRIAPPAERFLNDVSR